MAIKMSDTQRLASKANMRWAWSYEYFSLTICALWESDAGDRIMQRIGHSYESWMRRYEALSTVIAEDTRRIRWKRLEKCKTRGIWLQKARRKERGRGDDGTRGGKQKHDEWKGEWLFGWNTEIRSIWKTTAEDLRIFIEMRWTKKGRRMRRGGWLRELDYRRKMKG